MAQATVRTVNQNERIYEEGELRLRSALSAHRATGDERRVRTPLASLSARQLLPLGQIRDAAIR